MDNNEPFYMLNALWFKPEGGAEKYRKYLETAGPITQKHQAKPLLRMAPVESLIGEFDADLVFFIEWPSFEVFQRFVKRARLPENKPSARRSHYQVAAHPLPQSMTYGA